MAPKAEEEAEEEILPKGVPERVPSLLEIKRILPKHCFESNLLLSLYYAVQDAFIILLLYLTALAADFYLLNSKSSSLVLLLLRYSLWPTYWFFQGTMMWALFVVSHDCGHGSFSKYTLINDIVGNITNTFVLVPYYAWKLSHRHHHKNTANIDKDEIFYPVRKCEAKVNQEESLRPMLPYWGLGTAWFVYLALGYGYEPRNPKHFNPWDSLFKGHTLDVGISVICWCAWVFFALPAYAAHFGTWALVSHYLIPIFIFGSWLVIVTFLHHQDVDVPWYADHKWDFVRGQLSSVDRDYGWAHKLTHSIGTHQIHHLFSKIPHYHLEEATEVFRKHYPDLVRVCPDGIIQSFVKMFHIFVNQQLIDNDTEIHVYREEKVKAE